MLVFRSERSPEPGLARSEVVTAVVRSEHSPGPGLAWSVAATAAFSSGPGFAWLAAMPAFYSERSFERLVARPFSGNTSCKLAIAPCAESPSTSTLRFPFALRHKAFAHPVRTMRVGWFLLLQESRRL
jgi:hypothetical protein